MRTLQVVTRNGPIVAASVVRDGEEVMLISAEGIMIRMKVDDISRQGRTTQGVRLMRLDEADKVVAIAHVKARTTTTLPRAGKAACSRRTTRPVTGAM